MKGISKLDVRSVPLAVVDLETTGLHPGGDRIVEIAIVRIEPGERPRLVLDSLVNPQRRVSATEIHGITDSDVQDAPTFSDLRDHVYEALRGSVFASYNVYFDARFMGAEMARSGLDGFPPYLCLMYLRSVLDLGGRCTLSDACRAHKISHSASHVAADDAQAAAQLWLAYLTRMAQLEMSTFSDLVAGRSYKFIQSFNSPFFNGTPRNLGPTALRPRGSARRIQSMAERSTTPRVQVDRVGEYWDALMAALSDLEISISEIRYLEKKRRELSLSGAEVRSLHARAFTGILADVTEDQAVDAGEVGRIAAMADALRTLGWCPGDRLDVPRTVSASSEPREGFWRRLFG